MTLRGGFPEKRISLGQRVLGQRVHRVQQRPPLHLLSQKPLQLVNSHPTK